MFNNVELEDCGKLVVVRDLIVDWVTLEAEAAPSEEFSESLIDVLERLREIKARPVEVTSWNDSWFEAHKLFVYETFLYIVAALLKAGAYKDLHNVYSSHYLLPSTERYGKKRFDRFDDFYAFSETLNSVLAPEGKKLYSPAAALVKRQATRQDLPFTAIIQADLLTLLMALIIPETRWYPQLMHYADYGGEFPFFVRAAQHKHFLKLAAITGIGDVGVLRDAVARGYERLDVNRWHNFHFERNFAGSMNLDNLDTII